MICICTFTQVLDLCTLSTTVFWKVIKTVMTTTLLSIIRQKIRNLLREKSLLIVNMCSLYLHTHTHRLICYIAMLEIFLF